MRSQSPDAAGLGRYVMAVREYQQGFGGRRISRGVAFRGPRVEASCPAATDFRSHVTVFRLGSNAALDRPGVLGGTIMLRLVAAALAVLTCTAPAFGEVASPQSPTPLVNCDGNAWRNRRLELAPSAEGPLALRRSIARAQIGRAHV